jgi:3-keto-disaccharide hydrolase
MRKCMATAGLFVLAACLPLSAEEKGGWVKLFDGKTLNGWESEAQNWDVQDGAIHRHQTLEPKNFVDFGQYHIYYREVFADFDLKVEFKIRSGNAGIQYRSRLESGVHAQDGEALRPAGGVGPGGTPDIPLRTVAAAMADPLGKPLPATIKTLDDALTAGLLPKGPPYGNGTGHPWQVSGYQFDIYDSPTGNTGSFYEGQGRGVSANIGEVLHLTADANNNVVKTILGRTSDLTGPQYYKLGEWNQAEIIARGNTLIHMLNGRVFCVVIDDDPMRRALKGIVSLQLEGPADNEVWYRNVWLKKL